MTVSVSSVSSRPFRDFLDLAPLFHQDAPALGITLAGLMKRDDAVDTEMTKVLAQLAPRCKNALIALDCEVAEVRDIGTHSVFVAKVLATSEAEQGEPLLYQRRAYVTTCAL